MARNSRYCAPYRRRREGKTNYRTRKAFILSGKPRLVIRSSIQNVVTQIIVAEPGGDKVLVSAHSRELASKYGWKTPRGNLPAAYLTGFLCGSKAKAKGIEEAVPDIGLHTPSRGAKIFATLKGVVDGGVHIPHSEKKLPDEKRIVGEHIVKYAASLASTPEEYQARFSKYLGQKVPPEKMSENFAEVKNEIVAAFKRGGKEA